MDIFFRRHIDDLHVHEKMLNSINHKENVNHQNSTELSFHTA